MKSWAAGFVSIWLIIDLGDNMGEFTKAGAGLPEIAFSKMAGFDVTPRTPSSRTIRSSSPSVIMPRRM